MLLQYAIIILFYNNCIKLYMIKLSAYFGILPEYAGNDPHPLNLSLPYGIHRVGHKNASIRVSYARIEAPISKQKLAKGIFYSC